MTVMATSRQDATMMPPLADRQPAATSTTAQGYGQGNGPASGSPAASASLLDRFLTPPVSTPHAFLTPVQQGEAARARDLAAATGKPESPADDDAQREKWTDIVQSAYAVGPTIGAVVEGAANAVLPHPIAVDSTVTQRPDGTTLTTVTIDVAANFSVDGGTLPAGQTAQEEARTIEQSIERDFTKTYVDANGNETRYVTDVDMTVNGDGVGREQFVLVDATDPRLGGGLGIAPGFENGRTAYISDEAGERTAPHEFGHLAGLRHTAQVDQGCTTAPGIDIENLMSQTGCSPTSQQIERSQLEQIFNTSQFR